MSTLVTLATLSTLATLVTFAIRLLRYTCCACYSSFAIFTILATFACYTSCPCYADYACNAFWSCYACYIQQVVSIDNPISETLSNKKSYSFFLFYLSWFNFPFRVKNLLTKISISQSGHLFSEVYHICRPVVNNLTQEGIRSLSALQLSSTSLLWHLL